MVGDVILLDDSGLFNEEKYRGMRNLSGPKKSLKPTGKLDEGVKLTGCFFRI